MTTLLHQITITPKPATNGSLGGTTIACSCGFAMSTTLESDVQFIAHEHRVWADKPRVAPRKRRHAA